jgi:putative tryptophan/tyrosine transport system substrate-binding protein
MIDRRRRLVHLGGTALAALLPLCGGAQPLERVVRIGVLRHGARPVSPDDPVFQGFRLALRELGYVEGRNLVLDERFADGDVQRLPALARGLVAGRAEVILAVGAQAANAGRDAARSTPVVFFGNFDPVTIGLVGDLARPGGTLTGILIAPDGTLAGKRVELLKAAVPRATRIGLLLPHDAAVRAQADDTAKAARALGVQLIEATVVGADYAAAFAALVRERVDALVVASHSFFVRDRQAIIDLAARHRLPAIYEWREQVEDGGLMTYSTSLLDRYRRIASYVDHILKGTKAGDLPVDRSYRFELVINLKTARAIGLNIPQALLLRADEVIE